MAEMIASPDEFFKKQLELLTQKNRLRALLPFDLSTLNLISNDYHGFSRLPIQSSSASGAGGSRLLGGNHPAIEHLEKYIAHQLGTETVLVFPSGFQCHQSVLDTLVGSGQFVAIYDHLNHACLQSGVNSSRTPRYRFRHNDIQDCQKKIESAQQTHPHQTPLVIIESIHSMDGSVAPLTSFVELKRRTESWLVVDEAHAIGVCGKHSLGLADEIEVVNEVDVILGTFSKGLGAMGAFTATRKVIQKYLLNTCKGFIYTTGLSPAIADTIYQRFEKLHTHPHHIQQLRTRIFDFSLLSDRFRDHHPVSPIFKIEFASTEALFKAVQWLHNNKIAVGAVRPPTYPTPMIRVCVNSGLSDKDWRTVLQVFKQFFLEWHA